MELTITSIRVRSLQKSLGLDRTPLANSDGGSSGSMCSPTPSVSIGRRAYFCRNAERMNSLNTSKRLARVPRL